MQSKYGNIFVIVCLGLFMNSCALYCAIVASKPFRACEYEVRKLDKDSFQYSNGSLKCVVNLAMMNKNDEGTPTSTLKYGYFSLKLAGFNGMLLEGELNEPVEVPPPGEEKPINVTLQLNLLTLVHNKDKIAGITKAISDGNLEVELSIDTLVETSEGKTYRIRLERGITL